LNKLAGRTQKAIESYEIALRFEPENIDVLLALGDLYLAKDNWLAACSKYQEVIKNDPYDHEARVKVADIYLNHGDPAKLLRYYQEALPILKKIKNSQADEIEKKVKSVESMLKKK
jgi:tetratricopeptide (TPR) repeat protein